MFSQLTDRNMLISLLDYEYLLEGLEASFFAKSHHVLQDGCFDFLYRHGKRETSQTHEPITSTRKLENLPEYKHVKVSRSDPEHDMSLHPLTNGDSSDHCVILQNSGKLHLSGT